MCANMFADDVQGPSLSINIQFHMGRMGKEQMVLVVTSISQQPLVSGYVFILSIKIPNFGFWDIFQGLHISNVHIPNSSNVHK